MSYRLIALDLDDTLLDGSLNISQRNKSAIQAASKLGVIFTIATGRLFHTSLPFACQLGIADIDWPMINAHGAVTTNMRSGRILFQHSLSNSLTMAMIKDIEKMGFEVNLFADSSLYVEKENDYTCFYQSMDKCEVNVVGQLLPFLEKNSVPPIKITIINWDKKLLDDLEYFLITKYGSEIQAVQSREYYLEITDKRATKGQALEQVALCFSINRDQIIAIGDSFNDIDMIKYAGLGVAVANAPDYVQKAADLVTASNLEDGVAGVIEEYVLNNKLGEAGKS